MIILLGSPSAAQTVGNSCTPTFVFASDQTCTKTQGPMTMTGALTVSGGSVTASAFFGNGSALTGIQTQAPANMETTDTNQGISGIKTWASSGTFNAALLVNGTSVTASAFFGNGGSLTALSAANLTGTVANARIDSSSITMQGNAVNGASQLVRLDGSSKLPAVDGSALTNIPAPAGMETTNTNQGISGVKTWTSTPTFSASAFSVGGSTLSISQGQVGFGTNAPAGGFGVDVSTPAVFGLTGRSSFTVSGLYQPRVMTVAQIKAYTPLASEKFALITCADCVTSAMCLTTGTTKMGFCDVTLRTASCK